MQDYTIISSQIYREAKYGISLATSSKVCVIGEQTVKLDDGRIIEQYVYNIVEYLAKNGNVFNALKSNITLD